jgi:hypothetical protein
MQPFQPNTPEIHFGGLPVWSFTDAVSPERQAKLVAVPDFDAIVYRLMRGIVEDFWPEAREQPPCIGTKRAVFRLRVDADDYDAFFNSPVGYRAQYCEGFENGKRQNRRLLVSLQSLCLAYYRENTNPVFQERDVLASLGAENAKIWIYESEVAKVEGIHIAHEPWLTKLRAKNSGSLRDRSSRESAEVGVRAPRGTLLQIKGGWVARGGVECRDPAKARRAEDIHDYGHS